MTEMYVWLGTTLNCRLSFKTHHMWYLSLIKKLSWYFRQSSVYFLTELHVTHLRIPTLVPIAMWPYITYDTYTFNAT
jgi:hypothetical protein